MADITASLKTDLHMRTNSSGDVGRIAGLANYKRALFRRTYTVPGSLVHRPSYGVGLKKYQNAPSSFAQQQELASKIQEQYKQDPRTDEVLSVAIVSDDLTPEITYLRVSVKPVGYSEPLMLQLPLSGVSI